MNIQERKDNRKDMAMRITNIAGFLLFIYLGTVLLLAIKTISPNTASILCGIFFLALEMLLFIRSKLKREKFPFTFRDAIDITIGIFLIVVGVLGLREK